MVTSPNKVNLRPSYFTLNRQQRERVRYAIFTLTPREAAAQLRRAR